MHICVSKLNIIGSDNGLSPGRRQAIIWINTGNLLIAPLGINFSEMLIEIHTFSFKKMHKKCSLWNGGHLSRPQYVNDCNEICEMGHHYFDVVFLWPIFPPTLQWRHNGCDGVSNHQPDDCFLNRLFRRRSKKISKLRVTGLCEGNSPVTGDFPAQMSSNAENASILLRHHEILTTDTT